MSSSSHEQFTQFSDKEDIGNQMGDRIGVGRSSSFPETEIETENQRESSSSIFACPSKLFKQYANGSHQNTKSLLQFATKGYKESTQK